MTRRESREMAFLLLFEWSFRSDEGIAEIIELAQHCRMAEVDDFAEVLAGKTVEQIKRIDSLIENFSDKWKIGRLSRVTLAVLRMSICEIRSMEDIPVGATINEAVELMKKYATADEAAYVNGVLGAYHRSGEQPEKPLEEEQPEEYAESGELADQASVED